ncbi:hypothetical protein SASPL_151751 [Salvia splendens]|uniref:Uncharacterized protein n=1 Tax=Salvia splendens TaxID=180675 RepID=A0A8X8W1Y8_SALSN|nr:hypothetical protein SASPL_151751 [Salvia splendens]
MHAPENSTAAMLENILTSNRRALALICTGILIRHLLQTPTSCRLHTPTISPLAQILTLVGIHRTRQALLVAEYCPSQQLPFPDLPLHSPSPPTPRPYSCWDPPGQRTKQDADSQFLSHIVEADVSGGKRITWPGQSSIELQKECRVQTVVPPSMGDISPRDDGVIVVADRQEGKWKGDDDDFMATIKEQVDEKDRANFSRKNHGAVDPVKFTSEAEHQLEELPRLPPMRLRREVKLFNIHWEGKYECDAPEILDTDNAFLLGSFLEVPIRQETSTTGNMLGGEMRGQFSLHMFTKMASGVNVESEDVRSIEDMPTMISDTEYTWTNSYNNASASSYRRIYSRLK